MIFLKVLLICTFKDPNVAEIFTNLAVNIFLNVTPRSSWSLLFPSPGQNGRWCDILAAGEAQ